MFRQNCLKSTDGYIALRPLQAGQILLEIDLSEYFHAFDTFRNDEDNVEKIEQYEIIKGHVEYSFGSFQSTELWQKILAYLTRHLSFIEKIKIQKTPAVTFLEHSFIEIVKNSIDSIILLHYPENDLAPRTLLNDHCVRLLVQMKQEKDLGTITFTFTDNGSGFPQSFLEKTSTQEGKETLINLSGSEKQYLTADKRPKLMGGAGRGLRMLLSKVLSGDELVSTRKREPKYIRPALSNITFSNRTDGASGAIITLTTSQEPLDQATKVLSEEEKKTIDTIMSLNIHSLFAKKTRMQECGTPSPNRNLGNLSPMHGQRKRP